MPAARAKRGAEPRAKVPVPAGVYAASMKALVIAATLCTASAAHAFCGFYVAGGDQKMFNDATQVVLMRQGTRTVLSMQNNYKGPPEAFAMVVPVPTVLHEGDVKTLTKDVFAHVEQMGAPRLVEYWEQDPCRLPEPPMPPMRPGAGRISRADDSASTGKDLGVTIEAKFVVGEYQILILSAKDSTGLDTWLKQEKYTIPDGAEPLLRPYVEAGMKFFVAKVDPAKVKFVDGRAALSPLRFFYDTEDFSLPIRLGLANSSGTQDLIVNILAPSQRYEVANYKNVFIPTNIDVSESVKDKFGAFYAALFDRTLEKHPGAVVTEYAWQAMSCDPCPGPNLDYHDFATLGADVISDQSYDFVMTRLHARYGKADVPNDLVFKAADPIVGGREQRGPSGALEHGATPAEYNNFQGRYAIRHTWTGPIACASPVRGRWSGEPPAGSQLADQGVMAATNLAFAPRGKVALPNLVAQDIPEIDVKQGVPLPGGAGFRGKQGCGCQSSDASSLGGLVFGVALLIARRRKRA
jgi:MYXO-CTERM domain-containing protein